MIHIQEIRQPGKIHTYTKNNNLAYLEGLCRQGGWQTCIIREQEDVKMKWKMNIISKALVELNQVINLHLLIESFKH